MAKEPKIAYKGMRYRFIENLKVKQWKQHRYQYPDQQGH